MIKKDNNYYNKSLKDKASKLRTSMTKAEACLWKYILKGKQLKGFQFRRQRPVLYYIADFLCKDLNLIIEVDGITHHFNENYKKDLERQTKLEDAGFVVVRLKDEEILYNIEGVRQYLELTIDEIIKMQSSPVSSADTPSEGG
jgi:very-short-patch-repair endonuclease